MMIMMFLLFMILVCSYCYWEVMMMILILFSYLFFSRSIYDFYSMMSYSLGGDLISWNMIFLSFWIIILMILASPFLLKKNNKEFMLLCILLLMFLNLSFMTTNMFLFYLYFESTLIPTLFFIYGWGYQPERLNAGFYFIFYTLFGSLPLLLCILYLGYNSGSLFYFYIKGFNNFYLFISLFLAFFVKLPLYLFHFWLPKAHVEAPIFGSMILAGVLLKLGGYGMMRVMKFMYSYCINYSDYIISFCMVGSLVSSFTCLMQTDIKCLIAYSSVIHMNMVIMGLFSMNLWGFVGSIMMMIGHGLSSSGMFVLANIIYERSFSRSLFLNKGFINLMPSLSLIWFLLLINNMASPPSLNLFAELFIFNGIMSWSYFSIFFLMFISFLSCVISIYLYSMTQHGFIYSGYKNMNMVYFREYLLCMMHWLPLNLLILKYDFLLFLY